jgi:hypothetical protein
LEATLAEEEGFEPSVQFPIRHISNVLVSATHPLLPVRCEPEVTSERLLYRLTPLHVNAELEQTEGRGGQGDEEPPRTGEALSFAPRWPVSEGGRSEKS